MIEHTFRREVLIIHLLTWWGIRILSARLTHQVFFTDADMQAVEWWAARFLRAAVILAIVAIWAHQRNVSWQNIGLGKSHFWRNFILSAGVVAALWVALGNMYHIGEAPNPTNITLRITSTVVCFVDVVAQQLSTFGLLQGMLALRWGYIIPLGLAWLSFGTAHFIITPPITVVVSFVAGALFCLLMWRTKNLGSGLGLHFGFYLMLSVLGWKVQML